MLCPRCLVGWRGQFLSPMSKKNGISHIGDLVPDPENRRLHNPRNIGMVVDALHQVGAARSIVIDENNVVLAGNGVLEAAAEAGIERVQIVDADGETIVAVRRSGLSDADKRKLALFDNRAAELAEWDLDQLRADLDAGLDFEGLFRSEELDALLAEVSGPAGEGGLAPGVDPDELPENPETRCKPGDLWELGPHRLIVADCTEPTAVERLMGDERAKLLLTDPPYAVDYVEKARDMNRRGYVHSRGTLAAAIEGDGIEAGQEDALWRDAFVTALGSAVDEHAAVYIWHAQGRAMLTLYNLLAELGFLHHQTIIWEKNNFVIGRCDYQWIHEPCFYGWKKGSRPPFYGPKNQTTVWHESRDTNKPLHPTQKPVAVFTPAIRNHLKAGEVLYEPFAGSGTAIIAAQECGVRAFCCEVSPRHADTCLARWEAATGQTARLVQ
jgi:DNA modification methylase